MEEMNRAADTFGRLVLDIFYFKPNLKFDVQDPVVIIYILIVAAAVQKYVFVLDYSGSMTLTFLKNRKLRNACTGAYSINYFNTNAVI